MLIIPRGIRSWIDGSFQKRRKTKAADIPGPMKEKMKKVLKKG